MCICLPNGKFNFKFSRSYPCLRKKDSKNKHHPTLIEESSEEEEIHRKPIISNGNGLKKDPYNKIHGEYTNRQGHYRQLSRDRQLPPVPDSGEFPVSQNNSLRKPSLKQKNKNNDSSNANQDAPRQNIEEYGSISESETYGESRSNAQSPINAPPNLFKMTTAEEIKDVDPLYASVIPQMKRSEIKGGLEKPNNVQNYDYDKFLISHLNDHGYSMIIKKSPANEFSSLRKPDRSKALSKEHCHQSLQSLNNPAPGLPIRQYKQSELFHLTNGDRVSHESEVKMRDSKPLYNGSNSSRRFSQPHSVSDQNRRYSGSTNDQNISDQDILKNLQSTYNTPPNKRASLTNICPVDRNDSDSQLDARVSATEDSRIISAENVSENRDNTDFYRRITVRESLASLRERNALPDDIIPPPTTAASALHHVYEGLYETLYYSSADNGRNAPPIEVARVRSLALTQAPNPLQYLGQDNYLSITENPLAVNSFSTNSHLVARRSSLDRPNNDRSSVVYTTTGSDVYAEISDVYQSKQYDELPDSKQSFPTKLQQHDAAAGQINNGFIGCASPGSVRVLLEIQSFRHMDSDVDISSSRCATPLHPYGKSIAVLNGGSSNTTNKHSSWKSVTTSSSGGSGTAVIRHPWFLPQKSPHPANAPSTNQKLTAACPMSTVASPPTAAQQTTAVKPKCGQSNLAIMTPLMERSMEGSTMFLDSEHQRLSVGGGGNGSQSGIIDCLYDLFQQQQDTVAPSLRRACNLSSSSSSSPNNHRVVYPRFSGGCDHPK